LNEYLISLYTLKGNLYCAKAKYDSALYYLDKASALDTENSSMNVSTEIYRAYADVYEKKKDYKNAFLWLQKFERSNDTIAHRINAAAYLQIKAEKDNEASLDKIKSLEREKYFLIGIAMIVSMSFAVILVILIRLRNADKKLISKNIEVMKIEGQYHIHPGIHEEIIDRSDQPLSRDAETDTNKAITEDKIPNIHFVQLISQLEKIMSEEQLYLNPEISLDEIATKLESNRTYLSKAINQVYNTNFISYLNDLRIKDSIRIISQKESARFSIEGIAKEVGFNNRITFISAFKKYTGVTPSFFMKNLNVK
jgi:AraC-like DNA-binding protein